MSEPEPLRDKLFSWLTKSGYPLEMRVASSFRKQTQLAVRQGWHYADPETAVSREVDVVCTHSEALGLAAVHFAVSCKAGNKPWVLFTSPHTMENHNRLFRFAVASREARSAIADAIFPKFGADKPPRSLTWFWDDDVTGYTLTEAFSEKVDVPFSATLSAVKAALYCCSSSPQHDSAPRFSIAFPVVVTSAPLFGCSMDEAGEPELSEIETGFLFFQQKIFDLPAVRVSIVTEKGLKAYIQQCNSVVSELEELLAPVVAKAWDDITARSSSTAADSSGESKSDPK